MLNSVRARLTLWYTCSLALVLLAFAIAAYSFLAHAISRRTDNSLLEMARACDHRVRAEEVEIREGREQPPAGGWTSPPPEAARKDEAEPVQPKRSRVKKILRAGLKRFGKRLSH